tara:strand:+ start:1786 stop:2061 length:276 start_codon:yes stop_codon:yes gene_type:complete
MSEENTFTIIVTETQIQTMAAALQELPHKIAAPLLAHLQSEINNSIEKDKIANTTTMSQPTGADNNDSHETIYTDFHLEQDEEQDEEQEDL